MGILRSHGYDFQFEGNWFQTHPDKILVGRRVTAMMQPHRPDFHNLVQETGVSEEAVGALGHLEFKTEELTAIECDFGELTPESLHEKEVRQKCLYSYAAGLLSFRLSSLRRWGG